MKDADERVLRRLTHELAIEFASLLRLISYKVEIFYAFLDLEVARRFRKTSVILSEGLVRLILVHIVVADRDGRVTGMRHLFPKPVQYTFCLRGLPCVREHVGPLDEELRSIGVILNAHLERFLRFRNPLLQAIEIREVKIGSYGLRIGRDSLF